MLGTILAYIFLALMAAAIVVAFIHFLFMLSMTSRAKEVLSGQTEETFRPLATNELNQLPEPVQRYYRFAFPEQETPLIGLRLRMRGQYRVELDVEAGEGEGWKNTKVEHVVNTTRPAFLWSAFIRLNPYSWIAGWDALSDGDAEMLWKALSIRTLVSEDAEHIVRSGLVRYLMDAPLYPTVLFNGEHINWEAIDANSARAALTEGGRTVSALFHFKEDGSLLKAETSDRALNDGETMPCVQWYRDWQNSGDGPVLPRNIEYEWRLPAGGYSFGLFTLEAYEHLKTPA